MTADSESSSRRAVEGVLGSGSLRAELEAGRLMEVGTYDLQRLRPAGYDLVIARDGGLQVPSGTDPESPRKYKKGTPYPEPALILRPGDFAFVATKEKLSLPWDLAANVAVKNGFARRGLLLLTGLLIDPGYGYGESEPKPLHFGIANVSRKQLVIAFDTEPIASIQFLPVAGKVDVRPAGLPIEPEGPGGFVFFTRLEREVDKLDSKIAATEASVSTTLVLGAFVILATLIGSIVAILLGAISDADTSQATSSVIQLVKDNFAASVVLAVVAAGLGIALISLLLYPLARLVTARKKIGRFEREQRKRQRLEDRRLRNEYRAERKRINREQKLANEVAKSSPSSSPPP
jgi:deoxycytidine triphosphate deaminase